jgi:hypothetical protein
MYTRLVYTVSQDCSRKHCCGSETTVVTQLSIASTAALLDTVQRCFHLLRAPLLRDDEPGLDVALVLAFFLLSLLSLHCLHLLFSALYSSSKPSILYSLRSAVHAAALLACVRSWCCLTMRSMSESLGTMRTCPLRPRAAAAAAAAAATTASTLPSVQSGMSTVLLLSSASLSLSASPSSLLVFLLAVVLCFFFLLLLSSQSPLSFSNSTPLNTSHL